MSLFSSSNTFDPDTDIPDLSGRVYVVTGGSSGIGFGIMAHLLQHKASKIYLLSNKEEHADSATNELKEWGDAASVVEWIKCDLRDLQMVKDVAETLKGKLDRLDALVANAGLGVGKYSETKDDLDSHMQVNHFSQMLLIMILLPVLQKTPNARVVCQASDMHKLANSDTMFASREEMNVDIGPTNLYARTKLAQILFVRALQRRLENGTIVSGSGSGGSGNKIWVNATHPGAVETPQQEQAVDAYGLLGKIGVAAVKPFMKDPVKAGCRSALFAATSDDVVEQGLKAKYIVPDRLVQEPSKLASDEELGERLWALSEKVFKEKFGTLPY